MAAARIAKILQLRQIHIQKYRYALYKDRLSYRGSHILARHYFCITIFKDDIKIKRILSILYNSP